MAEKKTGNSLKTNELLWLTLGLIGVFVLGYFYVYPQIGTWSIDRAKAIARNQDVDELKQQLVEIESISKQLTNYSDETSRLTLAVPENAAFDELLVTLENVAAESGVVLNSVEPVDAEPNQVAQANVSLTGSFTGIKLFFEFLHNNLRPVKVADLSLIGASEVEGASLINASLLIDAAQALSTTNIDEGSK